MRERARRTPEGVKRGRGRAVALFVLTLLAATTFVSSPAAATYQFARWGGASRWTTSAVVSTNAFPNGADTVIVASGSTFPDALAAGPVAAALGGPVLLTPPTALPAAVDAELARLGPTQVLIAGGESAVSAAVAEEIELITGVTPNRLAGDNRYETAAALAAFAFPIATTVYVASGTSFPDALAGAPAGGFRDRPVLLTDRATLPAATAAMITALLHPSVVVLGGPAAVSDAVVAELDELTSGIVRRVAGSTRYATGIAVSVDTFPSASTVFLASGANFPDALSAAAAAGATSAPILLTHAPCVPAAVLTEIYRLGATSVITVGGPGVVSTTAAGLVPCSPPVTPRYSFLATAGNEWVRWSSCVREIHYHVYRPGASAAELAAIPAAVAAVEAASGFDLVFVGYIDDGSWPANSDASIEFIPAEPGGAIGQGGFWTIGNEAVEGFVEVEQGLPAAVLHHTLIHELAHMLGLDHADDLDQVMYWQVRTPRSQYESGDLEGLRLVGTTMPCLTTAALTREEPRLVTWVDDR